MRADEVHTVAGGFTYNHHPLQILETIAELLCAQKSVAAGEDIDLHFWKVQTRHKGMQPELLFAILAMCLKAVQVLQLLVKITCENQDH